MGRSQVAYNRTHGRGRGRGSKKGGLGRQQQQQQQPSSLAKTNIVGNDNSWRFQKPSSSSTSRSQSRQNEYEETAATLLNEYDNSVNYRHHSRDDDDDDDDMTTSTTGLTIDVVALTRVFEELPISVRLGLGPNFIGERVDEWDRQRRREGNKEQITKTIAEMRVDDMLSLGDGRESGDSIVTVTKEMSVDEKETKVDKDDGVTDDDKPGNDDNDDDDDDDDDSDEEDLDAWLDDIIS